MRGGSLNKAVTIIRPVGTIDPNTGGIVDGEPVTIVTGLPAAIEPVDVNALVRETLSAGAITNIVTHVVRIRYRPDVSVSIRVLYADSRKGTTRTFEVMAVVDPKERNRELQMLCAERVS
jgi:SPP1 family predicted phage head-tail adaptor